jgi:hypothetical protein
MAVEARAPCGDCNINNNRVILIKIITDGNLTLTKRLIKKILYLHSSCEKGKGRVQKKTRFQKREDRVHGSATKKN